MKIKLRNIFLIFLSILILGVKAQDPVNDSLKTALKNAKHDTTRCNILSILVETEMDEKIWPIYNAQLKSIAEKNLKNKNNPQLHNLYLLHLSTALNNSGYIFMNQGNIDMALNNYHSSLKILEEIKDMSGLAGSYNNIGYTYLNQGDISKALEYYYKALKIRNEQEDKYGIAILLNNIGYAYEKQKDKIKALKNYENSLKIYQELNDKRGIATELNNIGAIYGNGGDNLKALKYYSQSLKLRNEIGDKEGVAFSLNNISEALLNLGKINEAFVYAHQGYEKAIELGYPENIKLTAYRLAKIYKQQGKYDQALKMTELYFKMRDSISNEQTRKASIKKQFQYQYEKQAAADSVKHGEEQKVKNALLTAQQAQLKQEKTKGYSLFGGLALVLVFAGFMVNRFRVTSKQKQTIELKEIETQKQNVVITQQKHLVEEKHREITDSINYAERIQRSFLATKEQLDANLNEYFVLFKPKDVVSGDFYWSHSLQNGNFALVTADSTGHGVPGAIMSLLNTSSLEKAVELGITEPAEILNHTRQTIIDRLKKDGSAEGGKDGMDCSLIVLNIDKTKMVYSAANNPVWIIRNVRSSLSSQVACPPAGGVSRDENKKELIELKPDKIPVGKHDRDSVSFTQHEVDLQPGDMIYTLTDGFPDQFGGPKGKKFMYKKLKEILVSISAMPLDQQNDFLKKTLKEWMGNTEQVDDITIMGIRV